MRAWQVEENGEPDRVLRLGERAVPQPAPGQLRVKVAAAGLGLPDVFLCRGEYPFSPPFPFVPGQEVVGVVTAAGPGAEIPVGRRVMGVTAFYEGHGGFAEETIVPAATAFRVPEDMSDEDAASFVIPYHTAWIGLVRRGALLAGETLLVHGGAGGSGQAAIQVGRARGAKVIATAGGPAKVARCLEAGAHRAIDHSAEDFVEAVRAETSGRGADVVFDPVGGAVLERSLECTASEGRILVVGFASGGFARVSSGKAMMSNLSVVGVFVGAYDRTAMGPIHEQLLELSSRGDVCPLAARLVPFAELPMALAELAGRQMIGKSVTRPDT